MGFLFSFPEILSGIAHLPSHCQSELVQGTMDWLHEDCHRGHKADACDQASCSCSGMLLGCTCSSFLELEPRHGLKSLACGQACRVQQQHIASKPELQCCHTHHSLTHNTKRLLTSQY